MYAKGNGLSDSDVWRLQHVCVDALGKHLLADGQRIEADTQQVEVLLCLIRAYPGIVTKDVLIEQVWGGPYVTDAALQKTVSTLRRTLREQGLPEDTIETRHRRGYQLTVAPEACAPVGGEREASDVAAPKFAETSVAPPARRAWLWPLAALLVLAIAIAFAIERSREQAMPQLPEAVVVPATTAATHAARLSALSTSELVDTIKSAFSGDPAYAALAIIELRRRGADDADLAALAEKFDGVLAYRSGRFDAARDYYERALVAFRASGNRLEISNVLNNLGILLSESGRDPERAEALYRESLALRESLGDAAAVMASHRNLANLLLESGRVAEAEVAVAAYADAASRIGSASDRIDALILRGDVVRDGGGDARDLYREAATSAAAQGTPEIAAAAWQRIGKEELRGGQAGAARAAFEQAIGMYAQGDPGHQLPWLKYNLATAQEAMGHSEEALATYADVLQLAAGIDDSSLAIDARVNSARLLQQLGRDAEAAAVLDDAWRDAQRLGNALIRAGVRLARAEQALRANQIVAARGHVESARADIAGIDSWELDAGMRLQSAIIAIGEGTHARAASELAALREDAVRQRDTRFIARVDTTRAMLDLVEGRFVAGYVALQRPAVAAPLAPVGTTVAKPSPLLATLVLVFGGGLLFGAMAMAWARGLQRRVPSTE